jgi:integrase
MAVALHSLMEATVASLELRNETFHIFRHSFASNLAATGKPSDVINAWMGHQREEMQRR